MAYGNTAFVVLIVILVLLLLGAAFKPPNSSINPRGLFAILPCASTCLCDPYEALITSLSPHITPTIWVGGAAQKLCRPPQLHWDPKDPIPICLVPITPL